MLLRDIRFILALQINARAVDCRRDLIALRIHALVCSPVSCVARYTSIAITSNIRDISVTNDQSARAAAAVSTRLGIKSLLKLANSGTIVRQDHLCIRSRDSDDYRSSGS
jgi:hypothetical protein